MDFSYTFNIIILVRLHDKLYQLNVPEPDFLSDRSQRVSLDRYLCVIIGVAVLHQVKFFVLFSL